MRAVEVFRFIETLARLDEPRGFAGSTRSLAQALTNVRVLQAILRRGTNPRHSIAADPRDYTSAEPPLFSLNEDILRTKKSAPF